MLSQFGHPDVSHRTRVISRDRETALNRHTTAIGNVSELMLSGTNCANVGNSATDISSHLYLPTDPYAEGARAARAGLSLVNPYLLWPCVAAKYEAGFVGEQS